MRNLFMKKEIELLKAIAEPNRARILMMLREKPLCVCEITSVLHIKTSTVSNHLSILKEAGLIADAKDGKWINYKINQDVPLALHASLFALLDEMFAQNELIESDKQKIQTVDRHQITLNI